MKYSCRIPFTICQWLSGAKERYSLHEIFPHSKDRFLNDVLINQTYRYFTKEEKIPERRKNAHMWQRCLSRKLGAVKTTVLDRDNFKIVFLATSLKRV